MESSSNVVEKCLKFAGEDRRPRIVQELVSDSRLDQILQDPYGNYVIQAALNNSKGAAHAALLEAIRPCSGPPYQSIWEEDPLKQWPEDIA